ncbi:hypothetical protein KIN20_013258, partial [Parelaphostrongylus tenuis]
NDEEQQTLMSCLDLLIAAGYFLTRTKGLATFDKCSHYLFVIVAGKNGDGFQIVRADYLNSYINYQYGKKTHMQPSIPPLCEIYDDVHERIIPRRQFKRGKNLHYDSILDDAQCTFAEFSGRYEDD